MSPPSGSYKAVDVGCPFFKRDDGSHRITFDGNRVWQTSDNMEVRLVDPDNQQILIGEQWDARLVGSSIYGRNWFGAMYIRTELIEPEDHLLMVHLGEMQWVPLEME